MGNISFADFFLMEFVRCVSGTGSGSTIPGSGSVNPDPHQNEADPKHWYHSGVNKVPYSAPFPSGIISRPVMLIENRFNGSWPNLKMLNVKYYLL